MLNRLLFLIAIGLSLVLVALVLFAPALMELDAEELPRWLLLFALDATIRRAAIACAIGLFVTAFVFFRGSPTANTDRSKRARTTNTIGA